MAIATGRFVWFEYWGLDAGKAQSFFGELFGWKTRDISAEGNPYTMIAVGDDTIGGYWPPPPADAPQRASWIAHLQVESAKASCAKVKELGGQVMMEPMQVGQHGTFALVMDPTGAVFSLWQPDQMKGNPDYRGKAGCFCWNELMTTDVDKALAFYRALGGFATRALPMGEGGAYHILESDGRGRAGLMKVPMEGIPSHWTPYVQVDDVDTVVARGTKLGADVKVPPTDIPGTGRFALFLDPQGAPLGVLEPAPGARK